MQYGGVLGRSFYLFFKLILDQNSSKILVLYFMLEVDREADAILITLTAEVMTIMLIALNLDFIKKDTA